MRVLMIIDGLKMGGTERRMLSLVKKLEETGDITTEIVVLSRTIQYETEISSMVSPVHLIERKPKKDPRVFLKLIRICRNFKPDILHTWGSMPSVYAIPAKVLCRVPMVNGMIINAPERVPFREYFRAKLSFPFSDCIVSNSKAGIGVYKPPPDKTLCIPNGFNLDRIGKAFDKEPLRKIFGISTEFVVGMVGRFEKGKDFKSFIEAALLVLTHQTNVTFMAIGDGSMLETTRNLIPATFKDRIVFPGKIQDIEPVINLFDIGVLLSTNGEGISNVILEYMALEKAVIASDIPGNRESVDEGVSGYLIPYNSVPLIAEKIESLLNSPALRVEMGKKGKGLLMNRFLIDTMVARYIETYNMLIS